MADVPRFGVTVEQIDQLERLVRTISAAGDVIAVGGTDHLAPGSLQALGDSIFTSARAVREILDQIEEQRLAGAAEAVREDGPDRSRAGRKS